MKAYLTYLSDPPGVELIMSVQTLMGNNPHGIPGAGDCDDFTVFALAAAMYFGHPCKMVLAGNNRNNPTHVYAKINFEGWHIYDLTAPELDIVKNYTFTNEITITP
jgi:hypothetical protein